jgi:polygalacturonase
VVVPRGRWVTGAIALQSKVDLHLEDGATIAFSRDPAAYLPAVFTRWDSTASSRRMCWKAFAISCSPTSVSTAACGTSGSCSDDPPMKF